MLIDILQVMHGGYGSSYHVMNHVVDHQLQIIIKDIIGCNMHLELIDLLIPIFIVLAILGGYYLSDPDQF